MGDISMCVGGFCPLKLNCHRFTGKPDGSTDSYFTDPPYKMNMMLDDTFHSLGVVTVTCPFFWNNVDKKKKDVTTT